MVKTPFGIHSLDPCQDTDPFDKNVSTRKELAGSRGGFSIVMDASQFKFNLLWVAQAGKSAARFFFSFSEGVGSRGGFVLYVSLSLAPGGLRLRTWQVWCFSSALGQV